MKFLLKKSKNSPFCLSPRVVTPVRTETYDTWFFPCFYSTQATMLLSNF